MKTLVITSTKNQQLNDNLMNILSAARQIHSRCDVLVIGDTNCDELSRLAVVDKVLHLAEIKDQENMANFLANGLTKIVNNYTHVLTASDSYGKDLLPRIAGIMDLSQISEVIEVVSPNIFKKPMYAGNIVAEVESFDEIKLLTIRATSFAKYKETSEASTIEKIANVLEINSEINFVNEDLLHNDTIDLAHAQIVVTGGRSLGSKENFDELIGALARKLGAAVGASRAAVDAGYASNDCQVGQTGKVVAPKLYLAIGISGAVQHIAGMKDSKTVIAINLDSNAQIFEYADFGLIGDLFEIVPQLINDL